MIAELRDEACTLWATRWLAFRRKAAKVFPGLDFNFQVPTKGWGGGGGGGAQKNLTQKTK